METETLTGLIEFLTAVDAGAGRYGTRNRSRLGDHAGSANPVTESRYSAAVAVHVID